MREAQERVKATPPDTREAAIARLDLAQAEIRRWSRIHESQHDLEVRVRVGRELKSAPFQKSATIEALDSQYGRGRFDHH